ncbi:platelet binding protein GspB isoform X4 [Dermacentor albipictus]|uniref:platelet binding protein GspB isoform X4 n=1 Tax=Dermacentor albipictus TaxID=60249 RepID=UPI0031FD5CFA
MLSYACCQYVVTRVTLYHSALVDLSRSRSVHAVEHEPCCPDPQFISANDCKAVHYGVCSPLLKLPSFSVAPTSPAIIMAPQPPRPQSATSTATELSLEGLDPVELLAVDLEGKLEALVNSFVAQDKVKTAARKSKTAMASSQASAAKKLVSNQSSGGAGTSSVVPSFGGKQESKPSFKDDSGKKRVKSGDPEAKTTSKTSNDKLASDAAPRKVGTVLVTSGTGVTTKKDVTARVTPAGVKAPAADAPTTKDVTSKLKVSKSTLTYNSHENDAAKKKVDKPTSKTRSLLTVDGREHSPSSDASTDSEKTEKSPSPTPGSQRKVFKLSPPNVISLVTGAPKPAASPPPSFSATYVSAATPSKSTTTTVADKVAVRDSPSPKTSPKDSAKDSATRPSSHPSGPKEPSTKAPSTKAPSHEPSKPALSDSGSVSRERKTVQPSPSPTPKPVIAVKPVSGNRNATAATSAAMDFAKSRFQGLPEPKQFEELFKQKPCKNGHVVNDAKSRWESLSSPSSAAEQLWPNSVGSGRSSSAPVAIPGSNCNHDLQGPDLDSPLSTSPRRLNSPEALFLEASSPPSIPHPRLTSSQKQHIRERSLSPTERTHMHVPVRPFLTKGSVAERVLLFERCPERASLERTPAPAKGKPTVYNVWKQHHGTADSHSGSQSQHEKAFVESQTASLKRVVRSSTKQASCIPRFYYPAGKPMTPAQLDAHLVKVKAAFASLRDGRATSTNFSAIIRACGVPLYWKMPLYAACGGESRGYVTSDVFIDFWKRIVSTGRDEPTWFVKILSKATRNYLVPEDFIPMMQDVIDTHPGLTFLKEAVEFHSRYINTVIARIFYCVNRSWSGRITIPELRKSNFLQVLSLLEDEEDINQITEYFSYEHFYVIYCKFWELDKDHDLYIDRYDLSRHNEGAISMRMIDRIFSGAVTRGPIQKEGKMSYSEFVWFIMSEEDKRHPRSIEYWFRCMDIDGDGYLSMYELEYFYEEQLTRMEALGIETLPFSDCLCQMLDMVQPKQKGKVSLADLKRCKMTPIFFDTFFNLEKYLDHEQRDPFASRDHDGDGMEISDWDRYAADEYELLVAEEGNFENHELLYSDYDPDDDELSPNLEKLAAPLRCRTGRPGRLDDDEYDYAESDTDYHY